jgi:hypothetical protein
VLAVNGATASHCTLRLLHRWKRIPAKRRSRGRLAPVALLAVLAVNRLDEKRFGAANPSYLYR